MWICPIYGRHAKMKVTHYQRCPQGANYSIERLFMSVRSALPDNIDARLAISQFPSRGIWRRIYNTIEAAFRQGQVNHITGDVHFLTYLLRKKRTILTIHDCVLLGRLRGIKKKIFFFLWYWLPVKRSKIITVVSNATKQELLDHMNIDPDIIRIIPNCVSEDFMPVPYTFNSQKPRILQIGTGENKNVHLVAKALKNTKCHLRIVGKLSDLQIDTLETNNIEYSAVEGISDKDIIQEYQKCDMVVFASTYEGFGLPVLEAQATGRPVVTSNILPMREVAGSGACIVNPHDVGSIRAGVIEVIRTAATRERLIAEGLENIQRFTVETVAGQYLQLYEEISGQV
jgi:glycosyltransferase involved in cell wall biosynthesis